MMPDKEEKPTPKKQPNGKVFDVSRPGKALASPTSKPVISGHRPEAQAAQAAVSGVGEARPLLTKRKIQILPTGGIEVVDGKQPGSEEAVSGAPTAEPQPTNQPTEEDKAALASTALDAAVSGPPEVPSEPSTDEQGAMNHGSKLVIEPPAETPPTEAKPEETKPEPEPPAETPPPEAETKSEEPAPAEAEPEEERPLDASSVPEEPATPPEGQPAPEEAPPEPVIKPLFDDSGAVIVSHHERHRHGHHGLKVFSLLLLILILAAAALDIALDMGLLTLEGIPRTDFL